MAMQVCMGATLMCSFGTAPGKLIITPEKLVMNPTFSANIMDYIPMKNIMPFVMCLSLSNPAVASATSAALGVLTPVPCIPVTTAPWTPGSPTVLIQNQPSLNNTSICTCSYGGMITIVDPGQTSVFIP